MAVVNADPSAPLTKTSPRPISPGADSFRAVSFGGPRELKAPGSVEWCYQTLELLKIRWEREQFVASEFKAVLDEAIAHRIWERIPPDQPYGAYENMMRAELGTTPAQAERRILDHEQAGRLGGRGYKAIANSDSFIGQNTTRAYTLARLKRDRPDVHARVLAGELSPHAAAVACGLRRRMVSVPAEPAGAARALRRHLSAHRAQHAGHRPEHATWAASRSCGASRGGKGARCPAPAPSARIPSARPSTRRW